MQIHHYNPETGVYLGAGIADADPKREGRVLIPAHATAMAPPPAPSGQTPRWTGSSWELVQDHRGAAVYSMATAKRVAITETGPLPEGVTLLAPPEPNDGYAEVWDATAGAWATTEDHRGEIVYSTETGLPVAITEPGPLPDDVTATPPGEYQVWDTEAGGWVSDTGRMEDAIRAERDRRIETIVWRVQRYESETRLGIARTDDIAALDGYIQALRNIPAQAGFPWNGDIESAPWPSIP